GPTRQSTGKAKGRNNTFPSIYVLYPIHPQI
ncbi:unnamed protein product, partial [marine sediment metagenome]